MENVAYVIDERLNHRWSNSRPYSHRIQDHDCDVLLVYRDTAKGRAWYLKHSFSMFSRKLKKRVLIFVPGKQYLHFTHFMRVCLVLNFRPASSITHYRYQVPYPV
jgi:hypothetical protein